MKLSDEQALLIKAKQGDKQAFALLYRETVQPIYRYIYHRLLDEQLAEDLTSDVFIKALRGLPRYEYKGKPFIAWLYRIAHARVIDEYRRQSRQPELWNIDHLPIAVEPNMDDALLREDITHLLQEGLKRLTDEQQQVVILRFIEGLTLEEVAVIMSKKANAIKALQHRALRSLARIFAHMEVDIETILYGLD